MWELSRQHASWALGGRLSFAKGLGSACHQMIADGIACRSLTTTTTDCLLHLSTIHVCLFIMAPKGKSKGDKKGAAASTIAPTTKAPPTVIFPPLAEKIELECTVVMEDQILIIDVRVGRM